MENTFTGKIDYRESTSNRIENIYDEVMNTFDADDRMLLITEALTETEVIPDVGAAYTFVYMAKTPDIVYDQFPLIICVGLKKWGFKGFNVHWGNVRNYTWQEVVGYLHLVYPEEFEILTTIPYAKIVNK